MPFSSDPGFWTATSDASPDSALDSLSRTTRLPFKDPKPRHGEANYSMFDPLVNKKTIHSEKRAKRSFGMIYVSSCCRFMNLSLSVLDSRTPSSLSCAPSPLLPFPLPLLSPSFTLVNAGARGLSGISPSVDPHMHSMHGMHSHAQVDRSGNLFAHLHPKLITGPDTRAPEIPRQLIS